jgi:DNA-binding winged helix-turn-helix (wHTH) protein/Tol biopolymer transport system component
MQAVPQSAQVYQFAAFEVDLARGELRKHGVRIRLQEQPFQILVMLLDRAGELVSRDELCHKLWPPGTFVDFEQGLATAIKKLRQALGDDAETPRYIETVPKRGYRFIAPVEKPRGAPTPVKESTWEVPRPQVSQPVPVANTPYFGYDWWLPAVVLVLAATISLVWYFSRASRDRPLALRPQRVTANSTENSVIQSTLSPDGRVIAYGDQSGIHLQMIATREVWNVPRPPTFSRDDSWWPIAFFPDGDRLLVGSAVPTAQGLKLGAWVVLIHSGRATRIREDCIAQSVSPNGALIAFTSGGIGLRDEIWVMDSEGQALKKIASANDAVFSELRWSRDGQRITYRKQGVKDSRDVRVVVESIAIAGGPPVTLASNADRWGDFCWLPGGRLLFSFAPENSPDGDMNLWELSTDPTTGEPKGPPKKLTDWIGFGIEHLSLSSDATRLAFDKVSSQTDVYVGQLGARGLAAPPRRFTPDDYDDFPFAWSSDSKTVFFTIDRPGSGTILKQNLDDDQAEPIMSGSNTVGAVRLTPDGSSLLYIDYEGSAARLLQLPLSGGLPQLFGNQKTVLNVACAQKPATNCIAGVFVSERQRFVLFNIEPPNPEFHRLFELGFDLRLDPSWTVSPDGTRMAFNKNLTNGAEIDILSLDGKVQRKVPVKGFNRFRSIDWAADGRSWFVGAETAAGCSLLRVYPDGTYSVLVNMHGRGMRTYAIPSPNGEHVAFLGWTVNRNAWTVDHLQGER